MPRRRRKLALATPSEIETAIYSLETRGKQARSHIEQELRRIIAAAKAQLADYQKGKENHKRHKKRNPNWPSSIRSAAWFAANRRDRVDEPKQSAEAATRRLDGPQSEQHEWESLEHYEAWLQSTRTDDPGD
jgi:hypothetical protein